MRIDLAELAIAFGGLAAVGVGLWWVHPASSLIVVGGVLFGLTVWVRLKRFGASQDD